MTASSQSAASESWTVKRALDWTRTYLQSKGDGNPRLSAEWLISEACGMSRTDLYMSFDRQLVKAELDVLHNYVARRAAGEPLQYITGEVAFRHVMVKTAPGVLIPRPETEVLVSEALSLLPAAPRPRAADDGFIEALANGADAVLEGSVEGDSYDNVRRAVQAARDEVASRQGDQGLWLPISARAVAASPAQSLTNTRQRMSSQPISLPKRLPWLDATPPPLV